ncbi:hypothetical protein LJR225_003951 [Phenylobacterium sp. LjRoot225]|uniref:hypothetical protein n=1 Tax=Phenylobacterium sp. LjRoot225 TaxID=3342285 RepID=UPI003ED15EEB
MTPDTSPTIARTAGLALVISSLLALGAFALIHSPDLLAQAAWVYCAALLLVATPPPHRRALFTVLLLILVAIATSLQAAWGHEVSGADAVARMAGVCAAHLVIKVAALAPHAPTDGAELSPAVG